MLTRSKKVKRNNRQRTGTTRISIFLINADSSMSWYTSSVTVTFPSECSSAEGAGEPEAGSVNVSHTR